MARSACLYFLKHNGESNEGEFLHKSFVISRVDKLRDVSVEYSRSKNIRYARYCLAPFADERASGIQVREAMDLAPFQTPSPSTTLHFQTSTPLLYCSFWAVCYYLGDRSIHLSRPL